MIFLIRYFAQILNSVVVFAVIDMIKLIFWHNPIDIEPNDFVLEELASVDLYAAVSIWIVIARHCSWLDFIATRSDPK